MRLRLNIITKDIHHKLFFGMKDTQGKKVLELRNALSVFLKENSIITSSEHVNRLDIDGFDILDGLLVDDILNDNDIIK